MKVLVATAWSPTKSEYFKEYAAGISSALKSEVQTELYITATIADDRFSSIVRSMAEAQYYAMYNGFTHLFNVEATRRLPPGILESGLSRGKEVLLFSSIPLKDGEGPVRKFTRDLCNELNPNPSELMGWGTMLVEMSVLRRVPFEDGYRGGYLWPDVMWFKKLGLDGIDIWVDREHTVKLLEPADHTPGSSFAPGLGDYVDKQLEGLTCHLR